MAFNKIQRRQNYNEQESFEKQLQELKLQLAKDYLNDRQRQDFFEKIKEIERFCIEDKQYNFLIRKNGKVFLAYNVTEIIPPLVQIISDWRGYKISKKKDKYELVTGNTTYIGRFRQAVWAIASDSAYIIPTEAMDEYQVVPDINPNSEGEKFGKYYREHEEYWRKFLDALDKL